MAIASPAACAPVLRDTLRRAGHRVRLRRTVNAAFVGLIAGAGLSAALLLAVRVGWMENDNLPDALLLLPILMGVLVGAAWGASRPVPALPVARLTEQRLDLQERLSTAYSLSGSQSNSWVASQSADAERHAANLDLRRAFPLLPLPRTAWVGAALCAAAVGLLIAPNLSFLQSPEQKAEKAAVKKEGERIVRVARALERDAGAKKLDQAHQSALKMMELGKQMQGGKLTRQKALMKAAKLTAEMRAQQQSLAAAASTPNGEKSLARAGKELEKALQSANEAAKNAADSNTLTPPPAGDKVGDSGKSAAAATAATVAAQKAMEPVKKALADSNAPSLAEQLNKIADAAAKGEPKNADARNKMAQQVAALATALKNTSLSPASPALQKAANALQKGNHAEAAQQLREAAKKISEAEGKNADAKALERMANALSDKGDAPQGESGSEGSQMAEAATGSGSDDAFSSDGTKKSGKGNGLPLSEGVDPGGNGDGPPANGIGTGAGKVGGKKPPVAKGGSYLDAKLAPAENKTLNRKTQSAADARDQNGTRLYAPDGRNNNTKVTGKRGEQGKETVSYFRGAPDKAGASVPYYEVYSKYAPAAESALNREDIPATYKKQVRGYFDSLKPPTKK